MSDSNNNPYHIYEKASLALQHLKPTPGDVLVVYFPADIDRQQMAVTVELIADATKEWGVNMIALTNEYSIEHIPEERMNEMGWYRLPSASA